MNPKSLTKSAVLYCCAIPVVTALQPDKQVDLISRLATAAPPRLESSGDIVELGTVATRTMGAFGLVRYTPLGQLDTSFGTGGVVTPSFASNATVAASAVAIQSDDKIVVAGTVSTVALHGDSTRPSLWQGIWAIENDRYNR